MKKRGVTVRVFPFRAKNDPTWKSLSREFSARCLLKRRRRRRRRRRRLSINWTREFARIITNLLCEREFLREIRYTILNVIDINKSSRVK